MKRDGIAVPAMKARPPIVGCPRCNGGGPSYPCNCKTHCGYGTCQGAHPGSSRFSSAI